MFKNTLTLTQAVELEFTLYIYISPTVLNCFMSEGNFTLGRLGLDKTCDYSVSVVHLKKYEHCHTKLGAHQTKGTRLPEKLCLSALPNKL